MDKINDNVTKKLTFGIECGSFESEKIIVHKILLQRVWHIDQIQTIPKYIMKENEIYIYIYIYIYIRFPLERLKSTSSQKTSLEVE